MNGRGSVHVRRREWQGRPGRLTVRVDGDPVPPRRLVSGAGTTFDLPPGRHVFRAHWSVFSSRACVVDLDEGETVSLVTHLALVVPFVLPLDRGVVLRRATEAPDGHSCEAH